jgi:hypothetical protein
MVYRQKQLAERYLAPLFTKSSRRTPLWNIRISVNAVAVIGGLVVLVLMQNTLSKIKFLMKMLQ